MAIEDIPKTVRDYYEIHEWKHAVAILKNDFPDEWDDILSVLASFRLKRSWLEVGGGRKSKISGWIDGELYKRGWSEKGFETQIVVDDKNNGISYAQGGLFEESRCP